MNWWLTCMKKYADFSGRARRIEFWMFYLLNNLFAIAALLLDNTLGTTSEDSRYGVFELLLGLALALPTLAVSVRRLHDIGKSGWWILISLLPYIGPIILFVFLVTDSQAGNNEYGANPKTGSSHKIGSPEKRCPYCAEIIEREATVCRYCGKELPAIALPVGGVQIAKTEYSKLTYRQKFAVSEYGYLLSPEDAEIVGKMFGNFQEKDILPFCEANGKKVSSFQQ